MVTLDTETLPPMVTRESMAPPDHVPALTILCHPDPTRVGEQARLPSLARPRSIQLSRSEPLFRNVRDDDSQPLADPYVSRRPLTLSRLEGGGFRISGELEHAALVVDGEPASEPVTFDGGEALEKGVVIELARRIVLLLHWLGPTAERRGDLGIIGESPSMERVKENVLRVAQTDVPVLLSGESGTGKELVASAIHEKSLRKNEPYHAINMAAIPSTMAAAELFGHARGAFTGATADTEGYFARADGGTLFLDEVGDTPLDVQVMLLRVLETGEIQPVGARQVRHVDVRLIAATESDLDRAVSNGNIRLSFLQRLAGFQLHIPPLRERRDDIGRLLVHFLRDELAKFGDEGRLNAPVSREVRPWLSASLVSRLVRHSWPGNVRQLRNVARQLVISSHKAISLQIDDTVERLLQVTDAAPVSSPSTESDERTYDSMMTMPSTVPRIAEISDEELREAMKESDYQPAAAARALGIGRTSMYKLLADSSSLRLADEIPEKEIVECYERHSGDVLAMAGELEISARALKLRLGKLELETKS